MMLLPENQSDVGADFSARIEIHADGLAQYQGIIIDETGAILQEPSDAHTYIHPISGEVLGSNDLQIVTVDMAPGTRRVIGTLMGDVSIQYELGAGVIVEVPAGWAADTTGGTIFGLDTDMDWPVHVGRRQVDPFAEEDATSVIFERVW